MRTFTDAAGRVWTLEINLATARALRERMRNVETLRAVDFLDYAAVLLMFDDVFFAADFLYELCRDQAGERGIDASEFGAALKGPILFDAITELTAEYVDFFPDPTTREKALAVVEKAARARETLCAKKCAAAEASLEIVLESAATALGAVFSNDSGD